MDGEKLSDDINQEWRAEAAELMELLGALLSGLLMGVQSETPVEKEQIDDLFRKLHSLKGLARIAGSAEVEALLHALEDWVDGVRSDLGTFGVDMLDSLLDAHHLCEEVLAFLPGVIPDDFLVKLNKMTSEMIVIKEKEIQKKLSNKHHSVAQAKPTLSPTDWGAWERFCARSETLFALQFPHPAADELRAQAVDKIASFGDVVFESIFGSQALLCFAADLSADIVESILDSKVVTLDKKSPAPFRSCGSPWEDLLPNQQTNVSEASVLNQSVSLPMNKETKGTNTNALKNPDESPHAASALPEKNVTAVGHTLQGSGTADAPAHGSNGDDAHGEDFDDFDARNLSGNVAYAGADLDPEMLQDFLSNADELLETLGKSMLDLESNPQDKNAIEAIFRSAHTIKGTAGMFGFRAIEKLTHVMENLFDKIRRDQLQVSSALMDGLLFALDRIKSMFESLKKAQSSEVPINDCLQKLAGRAPSGNSMQSAATKAVGVAAPNGNNNVTTTDVTPLATAATVPSAAPVAEKTVLANAGAAPVPAAGAVQGAENTTIRVDLRRLDALVNLVGELVIDRTRFARIEEEIRSLSLRNGLSSHMSESVLMFGRHMNEVQSVIMKIRMVPIGNAFNKFTRVVRDLARTCEKEIDLEISGGETELDKAMVEEIADPLVHLVRNSVDHGIEKPETREEQGKTRRGKITLRAAQDGNMIVITVQDDGKGLHVDKIRAKGLQTGLIKETDLLTDKDIFNLIFEPGFSTADKVTNISGRGVGMDVVKKNILKLKGIIDLDSKVGYGTTITIKLPLTLAIIPSLMVEVQGLSYAIPIVNVIESIRIDPAEVQHVGTNSFVRLRDRILPLRRLSDVFELQKIAEKNWYTPQDSDSLESKDKRNNNAIMNSKFTSRKKPRILFVVVGSGENRVGLIVDRLRGQQEIVIKNLGRLLGKISGVAGGCVLGDGQVALVADVGEIIDASAKMNGAGVASAS